MDRERYSTVYRGEEAEIEEKKSRFIAHVAHAETEEEAQLFIAEIRKKYWDARHNCHAYVVGGSAMLSRCSDDGEPAMTAGRPILDVISGAALRDCVVVVTRYFGGVLLGTGGLIRAYTKAAQEGLKASCIIEKVPCARLSVDLDYGLAGKLQYLAAQEELHVPVTEYADNVHMELLIPDEKRQAFEKKLTAMSSGQLQAVEMEKCFMATVDGAVQSFGS